MLHSPAVAVLSAVQSSVVIVAATAHDMRVVQDLADTVWRRHYPGIISAEQIDYMLANGYSSQALEKFLVPGEAGLALARRDGDPVGFAAWYPPDAKRALKLDKLYVLPECHGMGIGRKLIEHVAARARAAGYPALTLNVNRRNAQAIAAYERCGFAIRERGDFPIGNGFVMEDYVMVREL